ncbi:carbamate kinase [candidate division KSB1 bacterium]|nr:carbamate kinase [candidate division KSB1 bacterium]
MKDKITVVALGGNAISREFEEGNIYQQFANTRKSLRGIVDLIGQGHKIALTHGNGPQIGNYLIRVEESRNIVPPIPLGVLVADVQGGMGYMISQTLINKLKKRKINRNVVTIVTQVLVNKDDSSINNPDKFVGPYYDESEVDRLEKERKWILKKDSNRGWRRVVPSPIPIKIIEKDVIKKLVDDGNVVIAAGGGGIPVYYQDDGRLEGVDAVIDKDRTAAILANDINAEDLIIITATDHVYLNFDKPDREPLNEISVALAKQYHADGQFPAGNMGPKIEAAINFIENGGKRTIITSLENTREAVTGKVGTVITG